MAFRSVNPANGNTLRVVDAFTPAQLESALQAAACGAWRLSAIGERAARLRAAAARLRGQAGEFATLITLEMGKPIREARAEIEKCAWACEYYAEQGPAFLADEPIETDAGRSLVAWQPLGTVLAVMPWNFPFWQVFRFAAPALMAGNTCLLKHASNVPQCALAIEAVFTGAGFPAGVFRSLMIPSAQVAGVICDPRVQAVTLTGSEPAGREVAAAAGSQIKKSVLELGGSDAFVVLEDADLQLAVQNAITSRFLNSGQSCIAAKRFIVLRQAAGEFQKLFVKYLEELKIGDPMDDGTDLGPLSRKDILESLEEQLRDAREKGARIIQRHHDFQKGFFFAPAVVLDPKEDMKVLKEEVFGPIAPIIVVDSEEEAVRTANATEYGLGASIWTRDLKRGERIAGQIEAGAIAINDFVRSDPRLPFGGVKRSGLGRELSHYGLKEFVNVKSIVVME